MCHMSHVRCHMSYVTCHLSPVTCFLSLTPTAKTKTKTCKHLGACQYQQYALRSEVSSPPGSGFSTRAQTYKYTTDGHSDLETESTKSADSKAANSCSCLWTTGMKVWLRQSAPSYLVLANIQYKPEPIPQTSIVYCILALARAAPHTWESLCPQVSSLNFFYECCWLCLLKKSKQNYIFWRAY